MTSLIASSAGTGANGTRIGQTYNADGQLASIDYPNCKRVTYDWTCCRMAPMCDDYGRSRFTYDVANRLVSAVDGTGHLFPPTRTPPVHLIPPSLAY